MILYRIRVVHQLITKPNTNINWLALVNGLNLEPVTGRQLGGQWFIDERKQLASELVDATQWAQVEHYQRNICRMVGK